MARRDREIEAVEEMLVEAWACLMRTPDRERGWLQSGARSWWPEVIRDPVTDYAAQEAPRRPLNRREMELLNSVFISPDAIVMKLGEDQRRLLAIVLAHRARGSLGAGSLWEAVLGQWRKLPGKAKLGTTDGLRARYDRILTRVAGLVRVPTMGIEMSGMKASAVIIDDPAR